MTGEATPQYSIVEVEGVTRIHRLMSHSRIVFLMWSPIERIHAASVWWLHLPLARNSRKGQTLEAIIAHKLIEGFDNPEIVAETSYW